MKAFCWGLGRCSANPRHCRSPISAASTHYSAIASRAVDYLNEQLKDKKYICGETYTVADIALFPWLRIHDHFGLSFENAKNLSRWHDAVLERDGTQKAISFLNEISS